MSKDPYTYKNDLQKRPASKEPCIIQRKPTKETRVFRDSTYLSHWSTLKSGTGAQFSCQERKYPRVLTIIHVLHSRRGYTARDVFDKTFKRDSCTHQKRPTKETH